MEMRTANEILRAKRKEKGLTMVQLARRTSLSAGRISDLEQGRRPIHKPEWRELAQVLDLNPFLEFSSVERPMRAGDWSAKPPNLKKSCSRDIRRKLWAAQLSYPSEVPTLIRKLGRLDDSRLKRQFLRESRLDSSSECLFWLKLLEQDTSLPKWLSPFKCGFRSLAIVDSVDGIQIGDLRFPCLDFRKGQLNALLFPQVTVQTRRGTYRLDALTKVRGSRRARWLDLEIDGPGHQSQFDLKRERALGLPTVRIQESDLTRPNFTELIAHRFGSVLDEAS